MENISGLEPPILYVFPSLPKSPNTNHTCRGKRPGKKYAEKKNHWENKKEQHSEPARSGSLGGACTEPHILHSSPKSSRSLHPARPSLAAAGGSGPAPRGPGGTWWDLLSGLGACHQQGSWLQSLEGHRHPSNPLHLPPGRERHHHQAHEPQPLGAIQEGTWEGTPLAGLTGS